MTQWNDNDEGNAKTREINSVIKVKGVPFKDSSRMYKVQTYKKLEYIYNKFNLIFSFKNLKKKQ